jgi:hypothetical protein
VLWIILAATTVLVAKVLALNTVCNVRVREEPEHYRAEDSLRFLSWSGFFDWGR